MKENEVPQDKSNFSKTNIKELVYAIDEEGNYKTALSSGWEPKTIALSNSIEEIKERIDWARKLVLNGEISPIAYFMELNKMDLSILSSYVGMWKWRVNRHLKPKVFKKLSDKVLQKYAETFSISVDKLRNYKGE
jgi:hypothetical protein